MSPRIKFFIKHLSVSFVVALIILGWIFTVWYPTPLAKATGVTYIVLLMVAIDVIVGPVLGFIVYKAHKKSLKFDLMVIILLQISALSYGIYSLAEGRPVWMAFNGNRFELIRNNELLGVSVDNEYYHPSLLGPKYVAVKIAEDKLEREQNMFEELQGGISLAQRPERYVNMNVVKDRLLKEQKSLEELNKYNEASKIDKALVSYHDAHGFLPLRAQQVDMVVLIDDSGTPLQIVDLRPWD